MPKKKNKIRKIILIETRFNESDVPPVILCEYFKQITGDKIYVYKSDIQDKMYAKVKDIKKLTKRKHFSFYYYTDIDFGNKIHADKLWCHIVGDFRELKRDDELLVQIVENYILSHPDFKIMKIIEIPREVKWDVREGDQGGEYISEKHRTWY